MVAICCWCIVLATATVVAAAVVAAAVEAAAAAATFLSKVAKSNLESMPKGCGWEDGGAVAVASIEKLEIKT